MRSSLLLALALRTCADDVNIGVPDFGPSVKPADGASRPFTAGEEDITCYRIPAIVSTGEALVAFAEARHGSCNDGSVHEIAVTRSLDHGQSWSEVSFAAGGPDKLVGNPFPIALSGGRLALLYVKHGPGCTGDCGTGNGIVFSDDGGVTWSAEHDVSADFGPASGSMPGPDAGIQLGSGPKAGRILTVSHHGAYEQDYVSFSDDEGQTWTTIDQSFPKMDEASVADLGGGKLLVNMRHRDEKSKGRATSRSEDSGETWSDITFDEGLLGPVCEGSLRQIGDSLYFSNPASTRGREDITVRRSTDEGQTWPDSLLIQSEACAGYSSLVGDQWTDKAGVSVSGLLYESSASGCIDFMAFPLSLSSAQRNTTAPLLV